jgi:hypothetical protein
MKMMVRTPGPGGVVADDGRLDLLDRYLHLPTTRPDPGCRVLSDPADDLGGSSVLGFVKRGGDVCMKRSGQ